MDGFRNRHYTALQKPAKNLLCGSFAVLFADLNEQRLFKHSASAFAEQRPRFVLNPVFFHPFMRLDLLIVRIRFDLICLGTDNRETANIGEPVRVEGA